MTDAAPEIHLGSGAFWFWPRPFWSSFDLSTARGLGISGLQVLCDPVTRAQPLPPADVVRGWPRDLAVTVHPSFHGDGFVFDAELERAFEELGAWLDETGVTDVVIHANHFGRRGADVAAVKQRLAPGARPKWGVRRRHHAGKRAD